MSKVRTIFFVTLKIKIQFFELLSNLSIKLNISYLIITTISHYSCTSQRFIIAKKGKEISIETYRENG